MKILFDLLYVVFMGVWRDCFGKNGWDLPIIKHRVVQHIIAFIATFCLAFFNHDVHWFWSLYLAGILQGLVWSSGHGAYYDIGTVKPDERMKERYEETLGHRVLDLICPESMKYGMVYDFIGMTLRYGLPFILLLPVLKWTCLFTGVLIAVDYFIYRYSTKDSIFHKRLLDPEIIAGLIVGLMVIVGL